MLLSNLSNTLARLRLAHAFAVLAFVALVACDGGRNVAQADQAPITVTDMLGRTVTLRAPAKRIVLAESRHILTVGLIDKDPVSLVAAWGNDLKRYSPETFAALRKRFPKADAIPEVGGLSGGAFSMEAVIAAKPDLVIFTLYGPAPEGIKKLDAARIPYVFVDFFQKPLTKTVPSMRMLGKLLGREREAEAFVAYYESHMAGVASRLAKAETKPAVFFHLNPDGKDCCFTSGPGNMSDFIAAAGGHNIGADKVPGAIGKLNLEYVLSRDPDFYLVGGGSTVALNGLKIGPSIPESDARDTLTKIMESPGVASLRAVRERRAGGIWLFFFDNPLFFVGVEEMAKMLHPAEFSDIDPDRTMAELNQRFLAFPLEGTFWVDAGSKGK
ncbi:MAG: ABC transporter substrate-binding protein [Pseudolabrys sp.]